MPISHKHSPFVYPEYISPLPADDLIKVGTIKQQLYNEGVEKVQNQIDTLDQYGLSIVKEADKKYFTQEMDKFMKVLNEGAAKTDFANINSLRDLLSVGRPLETDPLIMNALKSSQEVQRRQKVLSSMDTKDRGPANDYYFMEDYYDYLNDGKVGSVLSSGKEYIPYVDVNSKIAERVKNLKGDVYTKLSEMYNGYFDKATIEELTNYEVANFVKSELDEKELMQLNMNARHSLKQLGVENVQQIALQDFEQRYNQANKGLVTAIPELEKAKLMYQTSPTAYNKNELDKAEENVENLSIELESAYQNAQKFADVNQIDENVYYPYYLDNYITSKARNYSYKKELHDYQPNEFTKLNRQHNLAAHRDYMKYQYDLQKIAARKAEVNPKSGLLYNNKPNKNITGGIVTGTISTANGETGRRVAEIPRLVSNLNRLAGALRKDNGNSVAIAQIEKFADALNKATETDQRGTKQLKTIYEAYETFLGEMSEGKNYTAKVWDGLYSVISGNPRRPVDPTEVKRYVTRALVNPLKEVYNGLEQKRGKNTRIAINNSLNYDRHVLDNIDFIATPEILSDDNIYLGQPTQTFNEMFARMMTKTGSSFDVDDNESDDSDNSDSGESGNSEEESGFGD